MSIPVSCDGVKTHVFMDDSIAFSGKRYHPSAKAARGEDLDIEEPVPRRYASAFHFYATLPHMLGPTLIRDEVVQVCESREKGFLTASCSPRECQGRDQQLRDGLCSHGLFSPNPHEKRYILLAIP